MTGARGAETVGETEEDDAGEEDGGAEPGHGRLDEAAPIGEAEEDEAEGAAQGAEEEDRGGVAPAVGEGGDVARGEEDAAE